MPLKLLNIARWLFDLVNLLLIAWEDHYMFKFWNISKMFPVVVGWHTVGLLDQNVQKIVEKLPSRERQEVKSKFLFAGFPIFWKLYSWFWVFSLWNWVCIFFSLQKYSYHNVTWWAAALWTQPGRNSSWTAAAAKVWAHPFFIPFTFVNGVNSNLQWPF